MPHNFLNIKKILCLFSLALFLSVSFTSVSLNKDTDAIKKEQNGSEGKDKQNKQTELQEFSVEAILPVFGLEIPAILFSDVEDFFIVLDLGKPYYLAPLRVTSYFKNLFTCIIAINAP